MKRISIFSVVLLILVSPVFGTDVKESQHANLQVTANSIQVIENQDLMDCTFGIKGTFDGVKVDVQITVSDVSWLECGALKLGVKNAMK